MNKQLNNDLLQLETLLDKVKVQGLDYLAKIDKRQTSTKNIFQPNNVLDNHGIGTIEALQLFNKRFEPIIVATSGPRYWGFVVGGATPASIVGDWLTSIYDQNPFATKGHGDISALIELETIQLLLNFFELPADYLGGFVTGATMSNFTCLAVARQWVGKELRKDIAKDGVSDKIKILAATPHSSILKSLSMLGIGSNNLQILEVEEGNRESLNIDDLERQIQRLPDEPFILISSAGTVNTVDFDNLKAIAKLKEKYNFWWHIDAAFGAFAICSDNHKYLLDGWQIADSIAIDSHKWLNVPYESAVFFVKQKHSHLQAETFQNSNAPYLGNPLENFNYLNLLPENSRRLKALPVWFSLMAYGREGIKDIVNNNIKVAQSFGQFIENSDFFELLAPVRLNVVCFTLQGVANQDKVHTFLTKLNDTGQVFMTATIYKGKKAIRAAFVNWRTTINDINSTTELMQEIMTAI